MPNNAKRKATIKDPIACWFVLLLYASISHCLYAQYGVDRWTINNGLPQNEVRGITQTSDGYLWIATMDGLARFDGVRFTVFNKNNSSVIPSNRFTVLEQGEHGVLWLVTEGGDVLSYNRGTFRAYGENQGLENFRVSDLTADATGGVWVLSKGRVKKWNRISERFETALELGTRFYHPLGWDTNGFGAADRDHVYCFARGVLHRYLLPQRLRGLGYSCYAVDDQGNAWAGRGDSEWIGFAPGDPSEPHELPKDFLKSYSGNGGRHWDVRRSSSIYRTIRFSSAGQKVSIEFRRAFVDRQRNLWLASEGRGLYRLQDQPIKTYTVEQGLIDRDVYPVYQDHAGAIWLGAWHKGLSRFANNHFQNYGVADGLPNPLVTALLEDKNGRLWISTQDGLTTFHDGHFDTSLVPRLPQPVQAMHQDRNGTIWFGMREGLAEWKNGSLRMLTTADGLASFDVHAIAETNDGDLWFGGTGGLTQLHENHFVRWPENDSRTKSNIWSFYVDPDGDLWIGTFDSGLLYLKGNNLTRYTSREGLFDDGVFQILDDELGNLWMSCDRGIYRVRKQELIEFARGERKSVSSIAYGMIDGLLNLEANGGIMPAGIRSRDGRLWFPTQDGVAVIDPRSVSAPQSSPRPIIESVRVDQSQVPLDSEIRVPPSRNTVEIRYTAPDFYKPEQIRFRYRLEGLDSDWTEASLERSVSYAHLPAGNYGFQVSATNGNGVWSPATSPLQIAILAPFYKKSWFESLIVAGVGLAIYLAWQYRLAQLHAQQAQQLSFTQKLITSQENERMRIASELHDSLGQRLVVINTMAQLSLKNKASSGKQEDGNAFAEISTEALAAIEDTRLIAYDLRPVHLEQLGLTVSIDELITKTAAATHISITIDLEDIDEILPEQHHINLYRIVQEALSNILKYSSASEAGVRIRRTERGMILVIHDNGVGFEVEENANKTGRMGMGLRGMAERAALIGAAYRLRAVPGQGTEVTIEIDRKICR